MNDIEPKIREFSPGKSARIQLQGTSERYSTVWTVVSAKKSADIYIIPHMHGGELKVSLHSTGSWHVGMTGEAAAMHKVAGSRHWEIWKRGSELAVGLVRAWYLMIPDCELRTGIRDQKAIQLPPVGDSGAVSIEVLLARNSGPELSFDSAYIVGRWPLAGADESCIVVARMIGWSDAQVAWSNAIRDDISAQVRATGKSLQPDYRFYAHGHDEHGVRFGLELVPDTA